MEERDLQTTRHKEQGDPNLPLRRHMQFPHYRHRQHQDHEIRNDIKSRRRPVEPHRVDALCRYAGVVESAHGGAGEDGDEGVRDPYHGDKGDAKPCYALEEPNDEDSLVEEEDGDFDEGIAADVEDVVGVV